MDGSAFVVQATLRGQFSRTTDTWLTLDSLLGAAIFRRTGSIEQAHRDIPLSRTGQLWHGSAIFPIDARPSERPFIADLNPVRGGLAPYLERQPRRISRVGVREKPQVDRWPVEVCARVVWFGHGDMERTLELLHEIDAIGKRHRTGLGEIQRISAEPIERDCSLVLPDGTPARPIPRVMWHAGMNREPDVCDVATWRPRYLDVSQSSECALPTHRGLRASHLAFLSEAPPPPAFPELTPEDAAPETGIEFFHRHLGGRLAQAYGRERNAVSDAHARCGVCGTPNGLTQATRKSGLSLCPVCVSFAGGYTCIKTPGFMGGGWLGRVGPTHSHLVGTVSPEGDVPFASISDLSVDNTPEARRMFLYRHFMNPPAPPYVLFESDNSAPRVARQLRVTRHPRRVWVSGREAVCVDAVAVREGVLAWRRSALELGAVHRAARLREEAELSLDPKRREQAGAQLAKLLQETAGLKELLPLIAPRHTAEYRYFQAFARLEGDAGQTP